LVLVLFVSLLITVSCAQDPGYSYSAPPAGFTPSQTDSGARIAIALCEHKDDLEFVVTTTIPAEEMNGSYCIAIDSIYGNGNDSGQKGTNVSTTVDVVSNCLETARFNDTVDSQVYTVSREELSDRATGYYNSVYYQSYTLKVTLVDRTTGATVVGTKTISLKDYPVV